MCFVSSRSLSKKNIHGDQFPVFRMRYPLVFLFLFLLWLWFWFLTTSLSLVGNSGRLT